MSTAQLLADYGYLAVFIGSLLEGETILVLAGFAAYQGYLSLPVTLVLAFVGGTLGDQVFFWLGRGWGPSLLQRIPNAQRRVQRVKDLLEHHHAPVIVGIRFIYGLRISKGSTGTSARPSVCGSRRGEPDRPTWPGTGPSHARTQRYLLDGWSIPSPPAYEDAYLLVSGS